MSVSNDGVYRATRSAKDEAAYKLAKACLSEAFQQGKRCEALSGDCLKYAEIAEDARQMFRFSTPNVYRRAYLVGLKRGTRQRVWRDG